MTTRPHRRARLESPGPDEPAPAPVSADQLQALLGLDPAQEADAAAPAAAPADSGDLDNFAAGYAPRNGFLRGRAEPAGRSYAKKALENACGAVCAASPGPLEGRNNALNNAAYGMGRLLAGGWPVTEEEVTAALTNAAKAAGLEEDENCGPAGIAATIRSGLNGGKKKPRLNPDRNGPRPPPDPDANGRAGSEPHEQPGPSAWGPSSPGDAASPGGAGDTAGLEVSTLEGVQPLPVKYLVPGYLPLGKLVVFAGEGGLGKSLITLDLTARLTAGRPCLGLSYEPPPPCDILLFNCEDDIADTIAPRLDAAAADRRRVGYVRGLKTKNGKPADFSLAHYRELEAELCRRPGVRLAVIDPVVAYVGKAKVDDYKDSELRSLLGPLCDLAAARNVTFILVKHVTKGDTRKAVHKVGGSAGYVNAVRAAFLITAREDDKDRRLFLPLKSNLGPRPKGLAYRLEGLPDAERDFLLEGYTHLEPEDRARLGAQLVRVQWLGEDDVDPDTLTGSRGSEGGGKADRAAEWLVAYLGGHAQSRKLINEAARKKGFGRDTVYGAFQKLRGETLNASTMGKPGGEWFWGPAAKSWEEWTILPQTSESDPPTQKDSEDS